MDDGPARGRRKRPICRPEGGLRRPLPPCPWNLRQGARSPIPSRGLQPVSLESFLVLKRRQLADSKYAQMAGISRTSNRKHKLAQNKKGQGWKPLAFVVGGGRD